MSNTPGLVLQFFQWLHRDFNSSLGWIFLLPQTNSLKVGLFRLHLQVMKQTSAELSQKCVSLCFTMWGHSIADVWRSKKVPLTSDADGAAEPHQCNVVVVPRRVVVVVHEDPVHVGASYRAQVRAARHHSPAAHLLFAAARSKGDRVGEREREGKYDSLLELKN